MGNYLKLFLFFKDLLFYEYCPETMQTVALVEKILNQTAELWYLSDVALYSEIKNADQSYFAACNYIDILFDIKVNRNSSLVHDWNFTTLLPLLKAQARSKAVKSYFNL